MFKRRLHCCLNLRCFIVPIQHQNRAKIPGSIGSSLRKTEALQKSFKDFRSAYSPVADGSGAVKSHGPFLEQIEVMVRVKLPFVAAVKPFVNSKPAGLEINFNTVHSRGGPIPSDRYNGLVPKEWFFPTITVPNLSTLQVNVWWISNINSGIGRNGKAVLRVVNFQLAQPSFPGQFQVIKTTQYNSGIDIL